MNSMFESPRAARLRRFRRAVAGFVVALSIALTAPCAGRAQSLQPGGPTDMGAVPVGGSSLNFTFTFSATVPVTVSSVVPVEEGAPNQDFILTAGAPQTCTGTITPPRSCNINVTFTPKKIGFRRGAILIYDNNGAVITTQFVYGVGLAPQFTFSPVASTVLNTLAGLTPASFQSSAAVYDGSGNLYFNDYQNGRLLKQNTAGSIASVGAFTGTQHSGLAINGAGTLFLTLPSQGAVESITPGGASAQITVPGMTLTQPTGIAVDGAGFIYIADAQKNQVIRIAPDFSGSSVVATTGITLSSPFGLAVDHDNLYIADSGNGRIVRVVLATGVATALTATNALNQPYGIAVDPSGSVIAADAGSGNLVEVSPTGAVTPLTADSGYSLASLPLGVVLSTTGDLVASDATLGLVFISRSQGSLTFPTPTRVGSSDATDGYETVTVQNSGNQLIQFSPSAPTISSTDYADGPTNTCPVQQATSTPLAIAATCTYSFGFTPSVVGPDDAIASIRGTSVATGVAVTGIVDLNGTGQTPITSLTVTTNPTATSPGTPVSFTVTALQGTTPLTTFTGTVTFTMTDPSGIFLGGTSYTFTSADAGTHTFPASLGAQFNTPGKYTITAKYSTLSGTSNDVTVLYPSTTTLTSSVNPVPVGGQTTLTASVAGSGTAIVPTGTITFYDQGTQVLGTCTLVAGKCSYTPTIPVGPNQPITAYYSGDTNFASSVSNSISQTVNGYTSTTALTSSVNPSNIGQATTLTATVAPTAGQTNPPTLTGTVTFYDGPNALATVKLVNGIATYSATFTTAGSHSLTAVYSGDINYAASTSPTLAQTVNGGFTAAESFTSSVNPAAPGQSFTLTATITPTAGQTGAPVPTGKIAFYNGSTQMASVSLVNGSASYTTAFGVAGTYPLTAVYSGDSVYAASTAALTEAIGSAVASQTSISTAANPVGPNTAIYLYSTVAPGTGQSGTPTGTVSFYDGTTLLGTGTLVNGATKITTSFAVIGQHILKAVYSGDAAFNTSTSLNYKQFVSGYTATVGLTSSANPSKPNQSVTLTATLAPTAGQSTPPTLTGTVSFYDGATLLGMSKVSGGLATYSATFTTTGNHTLTAVYSGDTNYGSATSPALTQVVSSSLYTTQTALTAAPNPTSPGVVVALTATVAAIPGQSNTTAPTGTVSFYDGSTLLGTATLSSGTATYSATFSTTGAHSLTAVYSGDTGFSASTSAAVIETVNTYTASAMLTSSVNPSSIGQQTLLTAAITAAAGQSNPTAPTGTVSFYDGTTLLGTANVANGAATLPATFTTAGSHSLTAVYSGDTKYGAATSAAVVQVVNAVLAAAGVALTSSASPAYIQNAITFTATVTAAAGATAVPTGTVTFLSGTSPIGTSVIVNGVATLSYTFLMTGTDSITAMYNGDANFAGATSPAVNQVIEDFSLTLATPSGGSVTVLGGKTATYTFTLAPIGGTALAAATTFNISGFPSGSTYTFTPSTVAAGAGTTTITLAVTPPAATTTALLHRAPSHSATGYAPIVLAFLALPLALPLGRKRRPAALLLGMLVFAGALGLTGCLSDPQSGYYGTNPSTFALTVTATSGNLSHSANASLTRQ